VAKKTFNRWGSNQKVYAPKAVTPSRNWSARDVVVELGASLQLISGHARAVAASMNEVVESGRMLSEAFLHRGGIARGRSWFTQHQLRNPGAPPGEVAVDLEGAVTGRMRGRMSSLPGLQEAARRWPVATNALVQARHADRAAMMIQNVGVDLAIECDYSTLEARIITEIQQVLDAQIVQGFGLRESVFVENAAAMARGRSVFAAFAKAEATPTPDHPETGEVIKPTRIRRTLMGIQVADTRARDGGVKRDAELDTVAINFKTRKKT
jgi:hypothetical protein